MPDGIDFRIVAVAITVDYLHTWTVICNDGFCTVYSSWQSVPLYVRQWLCERNNPAHMIKGLGNGLVIVDKPLT